MNIVTAALTTSPLLGVAFILWKSGVLTALAKRISGKTEPSEETDARMSNLESFRYNAESNHFHDLENLKEDMREVKASMNQLYGHITDTRERVIRLEVKVNGNGKH